MNSAACASFVAATKKSNGEAEAKCMEDMLKESASSGGGDSSSDVACRAALGMSLLAAVATAAA